MTLADALGAEKADQTGRKVHGQIVAAIADKLAAQAMPTRGTGASPAKKSDAGL